MNWTYEYVKLFATWPMVILVIFMIFILLFKVEISRLIEKIKSISKEKIDFGDQLKETKELKETSKNLEEEKKQKDEEIKKYKGESSGLLRIAKQLSNEKEDLRLLLHYEKVYNIIFGGQIRILLHLKSVGGKDTLRNLFNIFNEIIKFNPRLVSYGFYNYTKFLTGMLLINQTGDYVEITEMGKDFLRYIEDNKYSLYKAG